MSAASLALAAPESMELTARGMASFSESALPAATRAAAAFMSTISRRGDFSQAAFFQSVTNLVVLITSFVDVVVAKVTQVRHNSM